MTDHTTAQGSETLEREGSLGRKRSDSFYFFMTLVTGKMVSCIGLGQLTFYETGPLGLCFILGR